MDTCAPLRRPLSALSLMLASALAVMAAIVPGGASVAAAPDGDRHADRARSHGIEAVLPALEVEHTPDAATVVAGSQAGFTLTVTNSGEGSALGAWLHDDLPPGPVWEFEVVHGTADCGAASSRTDDGIERMSLDCDLGDLPPSARVTVHVFAATNRDHCGVLENSAWTEASNHERELNVATTSVTCPEAPRLTLDMLADVEAVVITGTSDDPVSTPTVVTWTLSYALTGGPVSDVVITDQLPAGLLFLDASDGGELVGGVVTWTLGTLDESGSVNVRTSIDPERIARSTPTQNVAIIDSYETDPDDGRDSIRVATEPPPLGGNPTPSAGSPSTPAVLPDTAVGLGPDGRPVSVPLEVMATVAIGWFGALALATVTSGRRRR